MQFRFLALRSLSFTHKLNDHQLEIFLKTLSWSIAWVSQTNYRANEDISILFIAIDKNCDIHKFAIQLKSERIDSYHRLSQEDEVSDNLVFQLWTKEEI